MMIVVKTLAHGNNGYKAIVESESASEIFITPNVAPAVNKIIYQK